MSEGVCPHCEAYIGVAVRAHADLCQSVNLSPVAVVVTQHDSEAAAKGACMCHLCVVERATSS